MALLCPLRLFGLGLFSLTGIQIKLPIAAQYTPVFLCCLTSWAEEGRQPGNYTHYNVWLMLTYILFYSQLGGLSFKHRSKIRQDFRAGEQSRRQYRAQSTPELCCLARCPFSALRTPRCLINSRLATLPETFLTGAVRRMGKSEDERQGDTDQPPTSCIAGTARAEGP